MNEKELHPIPEGSVITEPMVAAYMEHFKCDRVTSIGGLLAWEQGKGQMDSRLVDLDISTGSSLFTPIREASYKARAEQVPDQLSLTKENATPAELEQHARDKAAADAAEAEAEKDANEGAADAESAEKEADEAKEEEAADADSEAEAASGAEGEGSEEGEAGEGTETDVDEAEGEAQAQ